ncbi:MAG TPA: anti-sigma factor [Terriglobales bacterium]|nr:anti-sigma factor [Terriglobales bacterium]
MTQHETQDDLLLYALRELTASERTRVEAHLTWCSQCRRETEAMQGTLGTALMTLAQPPPAAAVRERLLRQIHTETPTTVSVTERKRWFWVPVFATVLLAAVSVWLWRENAALRGQLKKPARTTPSDPAQQIRELLAASETEQFTLTPVKSAPVPQGKTVYRASTGTLVFVGSHLPQVASGKAYELWLLPASGAAPVPAGVFKPDANGNATVVLSNVAAGVRAKGFAITVEPESGSATPTLPIVMAGVRS